MSNATKNNYTPARKVRKIMHVEEFMKNVFRCTFRDMKVHTVPDLKIEGTDICIVHTKNHSALYNNFDSIPFMFSVFWSSEPENSSFIIGTDQYNEGVLTYNRSYQDDFTSSYDCSPEEFRFNMNIALPTANRIITRVSTALFEVLCEDEFVDFRNKVFVVRPKKLIKTYFMYRKYMQDGINTTDKSPTITQDIFRYIRRSIIGRF